MSITNRDRFPEVDFLKDDEIKVIGDVGGDPLAQVGTEQGTNDIIVSRCQTDRPGGEELFAVPLSELASHSKEVITIDETKVK